MALNVPRLLEELRFITIHPDKHDQGLWAEAETEVEVPEDRPVFAVDAPRPSACGSFGCLAGNTAIHEPNVELAWYEASYHTQDGKKIVTWQADEILDEYIRDYDDDLEREVDRPKMISEKAREVLGLTRRQGELLFDGDNTLDRLWELADQFSGGEINSSQDYAWSDYRIALSDAQREKDRAFAAAALRSEPRG